MGAWDFVDDDKDLEDALKHLILDLLTTSTFKVDAQEKILRAVQLQCTESVDASDCAGGGSAGLDSSSAPVHGPHPVLKNWIFEALPSSSRVMNPRSNLRFRAKGTLLSHPQKHKDTIGSDWCTSGICGFESEGLVTTVNGTPYRLEGEPCMKDCTDQVLKDAMKSFYECWLKGEKDEIDKAMKQLSSYFKTDDAASSKKTPEPVKAQEGKRPRNQPNKDVNTAAVKQTKRQ